MTLTLKTGGLAYFDSFAGPVPCKVLSITGTSGKAGSDQTVTVRFTAARGAYRSGETRTEWGLHIVPRRALYQRSGQFRILPYNVQCDTKAQEPQT